MTMNKIRSHAFGRDVYLLGERKTGEWVWLEAPQWNCDWYWGFGYIEEYTVNKHPERARDIQSHSHWSGLVGKQEYYDTEKGCFRLGSKYIHHLNMNPDMAGTVLTDGESWELADLMNTFYVLKEAAEVYHRGNSHLAMTGISLKDKEQEDHINNNLMPKIFNRVIEILTPKDIA